MKIKVYAHLITSKTKGEFFHHIQSRKETTKLYNEQSKIYELILEENPKGEYWGWYDYSEKKVLMIYFGEILFSVCFPYGYKAEVEAGRGEVKRFTVKKIK